MVVIVTGSSRNSLKGADIMVFPEYGLTSTNFEGGDVLSLAQMVPRPEDLVVPCFLNHTNHHTQVRFGGTVVVCGSGGGL